jgi:hypothetical protein
MMRWPRQPDAPTVAGLTLAPSPAVALRWRHDGTSWLLHSTLQSSRLAAGSDGELQPARRRRHQGRVGEHPAPPPSFPIPVDRAVFDVMQRAELEGDEDMLEAVRSTYERIAGTHRQEVLVVTTDGHLVEVELVDGPYVGRRGWLKSWELAP